MSESNNRGTGNMADALRTRRRRPQEQGTERGERGQTSQKRGRKRIGKRSNPDYLLASALVRKDVYERVRQALLDGEVRRDLLADLAEGGVLHQAGKPNYSDLVEMLLREWLDRSGWEVE